MLSFCFSLLERLHYQSMPDYDCSMQEMHTIPTLTLFVNIATDFHHLLQKHLFPIIWNHFSKKPASIFYKKDGDPVFDNFCHMILETLTQNILLNSAVETVQRSLAVGKTNISCLRSTCDGYSRKNFFQWYYVFNLGTHSTRDSFQSTSAGCIRSTNMQWSWL